MNEIFDFEPERTEITERVWTSLVEVSLVPRQPGQPALAQRMDVDIGRLGVRQPHRVRRVVRYGMAALAVKGDVLDAVGIKYHNAHVKMPICCR